MTRNLGATSLKRTRRKADPMQLYDELPGPLRQWLSQAALPWSPVSAKRIWVNALAKGMSEEETLMTLSRAEARSLERDKFVAR